jgi:hypothetical protein
MSDLLSLSRMARRIGVPAAWLRAQADAGRVPCLRVGKRYLFHVCTVQEAVARMAANPNAKEGPSHE